MTDDDLITELIQREGGFTDNPADKGGPTKYGVTQATLAAWRGTDVTAADVQALSVADARQILYQMFLVRPGLSVITDPELRGEAFDISVNSGPEAAVKMFQRALGVPPDGIFGAVTLSALLAADNRQLYYRLAAQRLRFLGQIITRNPSQAVFAAGWLNRVASFLEVE